MATSGTYTFQQTENRKLIDDAFLRIGVLPNLIVSEQLEIAIFSANLVLANFMNKGINQWTRRSGLLSLVPGQATYPVDPQTNQILVANIRTSMRQLGGLPFSSAGGIASNAFDGNPNTACTQTAPNGYISYNYGTGSFVSIGMVGIQSNVTTTYTLSFEYSNDNINWTVAQSVPIQTYIRGENTWFVLNAPVPAQYFRVRETGGGTLDIQELYFNNTVQDRSITELSISDYYRIPFKQQVGVTSSFFFDRQIQPTVTFWPVPNGTYYNAFFYVYTKNIQDIGELTNQPDIPPRFYESLCNLLAFQLALKFPQLAVPERVALLKPLADEAFDLAAREDSPKTPLKICGDLTGWRE